MLPQCGKSCKEHDLAVYQDRKALLNESDAKAINSFYDIVEIDLLGQELDFNIFKGKVVYIVNTATYDRFSDENFQLIKKLQKYYSKGLEVIVAPSNQFGFLEPGDSIAIAKFLKFQEYEGRALMKMDVNGLHTRPLYGFLKNSTEMNFIEWNYMGKFLVSRQGRVWIPTTMDKLESEINILLNEGKENGGELDADNADDDEL